MASWSRRFIWIDWQSKLCHSCMVLALFGMLRSTLKDRNHQIWFSDVVLKFCISITSGGQRCFFCLATCLRWAHGLLRLMLCRGTFWCRWSSTRRAGVWWCGEQSETYSEDATGMLSCWVQGLWSAHRFIISGRVGWINAKWSKRYDLFQAERWVIFCFCGLEGWESQGARCCLWFGKDLPLNHYDSKL